MGGILSKPKIPGPSAEELKMQADARQAQADEKTMLAEKQEAEDRKKIEEMQMMQQRKRGQRYGGMRSLLADRVDPETGVKKTTLG